MNNNIPTESPTGFDAGREFGRLMQQARESVGYTVERAALASRIPQAKIKAMESGMLRELPESVFVRGFIKSLCKIYGTDHKVVLRAYEIACQPPSVITAEKKPMPQQIDKPQNPVPPPPAQISQVQKTSQMVHQNVQQGRQAPEVHPPKSNQSMKVPPIKGTDRSSSSVLRYSFIVLFTLVGVAVAYNVAQKVKRTKSTTRNNPKIAAPKTVESKNDSPMTTIDIHTGADSAAPEMPVADSAPADIVTENVSESAETSKEVDSLRTVDTTKSVEPPKPVGTPKEAVKTVEPSKPEAVSQNKNPAASVAKTSSPLSHDDGEAVTGQQLVEIVVKEKVSVRISRDDQAWVTQELTPETYQYRFDRNAKLMVMDASAVEINFNGRSLGVLGQKGRKRRISFEREYNAPKP